MCLEKFAHHLAHELGAVVKGTWSVSVSDIIIIILLRLYLSYQKSAQSVNFCNSVGVAKYNPWPLLLKQNVFEILKVAQRRRKLKPRQVNGGI